MKLTSSWLKIVEDTDFIKVDPCVVINLKFEIIHFVL